ncbi:MAG: FtsX-like permease family protein [Acetatifactor sp.]|nr:FtsX-like permease family protein [Acetatifactor sp.]
MKHYLDLVSISAKHHKKQNRMTRLCIVLAVFLVTVIFSMADMEMRSQMVQAIKSDGAWHAVFALDEEQGALLAARPEVKKAVRYGALNYHLDEGYQIDGIETGICGFDRELLEILPAAEILEGTFPENAGETLINEQAKNRLGLGIGDSVTLMTPQGDTIQYHITGISKETALTARYDACVLYLNAEEFHALYEGDEGEAKEMVTFVTFRSFCNIPKTIQEISTQFELKPEEVGQNAKVLMLMFQSRDPYMMGFYFVAVVLAVLVMVAGILMITSSMNSNIARRTEFFGMMRCLGATGRQVIRFVRAEALSWCKSAIPAGVLAGMAVTWILCGMLRVLSPRLFDGMPVFGVSYPGLAAGIIMGFITVLLAARMPARRAAKVSPLTAVSGNAGTVQAVKRAANTRFFKVDTSLGMHHATGSKKNFFLVTGSFAFSIILFLSFSTAIDFMYHAITPLRPGAPDFYVYSENSSNSIPMELAEQISRYSHVKRAFGRSYAVFTLPLEEQEMELTVISYEEQQFRWAEDDLLEGSFRDAVEGKGLLLAFRESNRISVGDSVVISNGGGSHEVPVVGTLGSVPFSYSTNKDVGDGEGIAICSEDLFQELFGEAGYAVIDIQFRSGVTDEEVQELRRMIEQSCGDGIAFSDRRIGNREIKGASYSMAVFLYGFLAVIALIAFFNIVNCIAMSVSARMREYGAMRAVGMTVRQLIRMVWGETMTYTFFGVVFGCLVGLPLNRLLFQTLVTSRWGDAWELPGRELLIILSVMLCSACLAVRRPARQIREMTVVDTIGTD